MTVNYTQEIALREQILNTFVQGAKIIVNVYLKRQNTILGYLTHCLIKTDIVSISTYKGISSQQRAKKVLR